MKRILTAVCAAMAAIATAQPTFATVKEATQLAQQAWDAMTIHEWASAATFLEQAIEANPNSCIAEYYEDMRVVAVEGEGLKQQGWNKEQMDWWYEMRIQHVSEDCWE